MAKTGAAYQHWDFHALVEPLLQQAEHEALSSGHDYVGSEHLVLAMARGSDRQLSTLFKQHGISYEKLQEMVVTLLRE